MVRFEIKMIFWYKKNLKWLFPVAEWQFTVVELTILNMLEYDILTILRNRNDQNGQNKYKQTILLNFRDQFGICKILYSN